MEEHIGEAFAVTEQLTFIGKQLHVGDPAPDFRLDYLDLADQALRTISLADSRGMVRLLSVVNSLERSVCQRVTRQWEALCAALPPNGCIYTVSRDSPQMQAHWQDTAGVLHQTLSALGREQFGQDYGVWLKEWRLLQRAVFVLDRNDRIVYVEYVADQVREPDYTAALQAVQLAVEEGWSGRNRSSHPFRSGTVMSQLWYLQKATKEMNHDLRRSQHFSRGWGIWTCLES